MKNFCTIKKSDDLPDHKHVIEKALAQGFTALEKHSARMSQPDKESSFFDALIIFETQVAQKKFLKNPEHFKSEQTKLYEIIYNQKNEYTIEEKLFFEFLIGLCRFSLSLQLYIEFANFLTTKKLIASFDKEKVDTILKPELSTFWQPLQYITILGKTYIEHVMTETDGFKKISFRENIHEFFEQNLEFKILAQYLVSMHYIPKKHDDKIILGLAQMLHWCGFGGSGELLKKYKVLEPLLLHRIGYHDRETGGFNNRSLVLFEQLNASKDYANQTSIDILLKNFKEGETIRILDVGSGPDYLAAATIVEELTKNKRNVELTASEVDTTGVNALLKKVTPEGPLVDARYFDLNFIGDISEKEIPANTFDVITARLVLHQLSQEDIEQAFLFFTKIVKLGGFIFNLDVDSGGFPQALLVPANNVDREGHVPSPTLRSLPQVNETEGKTKIAYPLLDKSKSFPSKEQNIYTFNMYQIISISKDVANNINNFWKAKKFDEANSLIRETQPQFV